MWARLIKSARIGVDREVRCWCYPLKTAAPLGGIHGVEVVIFLLWSSHLRPVASAFGSWVEAGPFFSWYRLVRIARLFSPGGEFRGLLVTLLFYVYSGTGHLEH